MDNKRDRLARYPGGGEEEAKFGAEAMAKPTGHIISVTINVIRMRINFISLFLCCETATPEKVCSCKC